MSSAIALSGCVNDSSVGSMEQARNCLQWQMNLLTHIEDVQNQLSGRMDLIEKELDGKGKKYGKCHYRVKCICITT